MTASARCTAATTRVAAGPAERDGHSGDEGRMSVSAGERDANDAADSVRVGVHADGFGAGCQGEELPMKRLGWQGGCRQPSHLRKLSGNPDSRQGTHLLLLEAILIHVLSGRGRFSDHGGRK